MAELLTPKKIYGLIGYPVKHSFSPAMHNAAFQALGIDAEYRLFPLKEDELKSFFTDLNKNNILGLNVTIPYKERVISFLNKLSPEAKLIGAVNTVRVSQDKIEGFNTDGGGFLKHLTGELKFIPTGKKIAMIGAGGAAKSLCVYLSKEKPNRIFVFDVDKTKAAALIIHLKEHFAGIEFKESESVEGLNIKDSDLLINATPIGMKEADPCLVKAESMHKGLLVYDLIYNPKETALLRIAKQKGALVSNGLGMLLYQGVDALELWTEQKAPVQVMRNALTEAMNK